MLHGAYAVDPQSSRSLRSAGAIGVPPVVRSTRQHLDRRFTALGFTVVATGSPWFEVFVTTDSSLFDAPERRTPATWFASDVTLTLDGRGRYVVPTASLARLLGTATGTLWYAAVGYADPDRNGATPLSRPASVSIAEGFRPSTRATRHTAALGVSRAMGFAALVAPTPAEDRRAGEDGADVARPVSAPVPFARAAEIDPAVDRRAGEDGADVPLPTAAPAPLPPPSPMPMPAPMPAPDVMPAPPIPLALAADPDDRLDDRDDTYDRYGTAYEDGWEAVAGPLLEGFSAGDGRGPAQPLADEWDDLAADDPYGPVPAPLDLDEPLTPAAPPSPAPAQVPVKVTYPTLLLAPEAKRKLVELVAAGPEGNGYVAINADGAFKGRFGPDHKAYQRYHTGLSFGIAGFNQDDGTLGQLLTLMHERDATTFDSIFGADAAALLQVANAPGPSSELAPDGRGPRVQPVGGADLWEAPWIERFRAAGRQAVFQAAQNQLCAELYLDPMLPLASGFDLATERGVAVLLDRAVSLGVQVARRWVADTIGPIRTIAMRQQALSALGLESVEALQRAVPELLVDGEFGPLSHATLAGALRALGPASPVPVLTTVQALDALVERGKQETWGGRLAQLRAAPELGDTPFAP